ncbi:MAG TPA: hypothetical protein VMU19_14065 [Bryobacteraceae bacterium]|nr:hypothetical protein [Bryobacteraceae bacterium]
MAALPLAAAEAPLPPYVPANAQLIVGLRVRSVAAFLAEQGVYQEVQAAYGQFLAHSPLEGIDPLRDVDEVLLAVAGDGKNPPTLAVMTGRFPAAGFRAKGKPYKNALIVEMPEAPGQSMAFLDANTLIAGDAPLVRAAVDGATGAALDPALDARAAELRAQYDVWGIGTTPAGAEVPAAAGPLNSIDRFSFGVSLSHGLECVADLHARSPKDLEKLRSSLQILEDLSKLQPAGGDQGHFDLRIANGSAQFSLSVSAEALKKAIAQQQAALAASRPTHPAEPPAPPRATIVQGPKGDTIGVMLPGRP